MPVVGYVCPPWTEQGARNESHTPQFCITRCTEKCMSPGMIAAITSVNQSNPHIGRYVSATALTGCKRKLNLERTLDYCETFERLWASFRGTIIHKVVEEASEVKLFPGGKCLLDLGFLAEHHLKVGWCLDCAAPFSCAPDANAETFNQNCPVCGGEETFLFGGTLDLLSPGVYFGLGEFDEETGTLVCVLEDNKTMAEYAFKLFVVGSPENTLHPNVKSDYVWQANIYAYLLKYSRIPDILAERGVKRIEVAQSRIQAISMSKPAYLGSSTMFKKDYRQPEKQYDLPTIQLFDEEVVREFIQRESRPIYDSLVTGRDRAPIIAPSKNAKHPHSFLCALCAFAGTEHCPNSDLEWSHLQNGAEPEEAFQEAYGSVFHAELEGVHD